MPQTSIPVFEIRPPKFSFFTLITAFRELFSYTDLLQTLCAHRIRVRYKQSALGLSWALLQPLSMMLIYTIIFSVFTRMPSNDIPYALFVFSALLPWIYFSSAVTNAANSLVGHQNLISKVFFPRELLPISYLVASLFDLVIGLGMFFLLGLYYRISYSWVVLWAIPLVVGLTLFAVGVGFLLAALQVRFRDIGLALPLVMQLAMFACPVVYPLSSVPARYQIFFQLNPVAIYVENFRRVMAEQKMPDVALLWISFAISLLVLVAGYAFLKAEESTMIDSI